MKPIKDWTLEEVKEECIKNREDGYVPMYRCCHCRAQQFCYKCQKLIPDGWDFTPPTQKEEIEWHKFSILDRPPKRGVYLITLMDGEVDTAEFVNGAFYHEAGFHFTKLGVSAWAEKPKGYTEDKQ